MLQISLYSTGDSLERNAKQKLDLSFCICKFIRKCKLFCYFQITEVTKLKDVFSKFLIVHFNLVSLPKLTYLDRWLLKFIKRF